MSAAELRVIEGSLSKDALIGQTVDGRYLVERVLGEGGMGLVYRTKHIVLGKLLAMKVLRHDVSRDEEIIARFRQEAQSASSIGNQHIIDISDFGVLPDGSTYFVMEYLDGIELTKAVERESPMSFPRISHITRQLCDALGAAHLVGIVHRDLKPDNVYLVKRGQDANFVKVLDFGIAKVGGASSKLTRAGQVFGTPHYMSPEQCEGSGVDHRTDIYAIGIMLYEMVTGRVPFDSDSLMGILSKHLFEAPVPPSQLRPDCPRELDAIILRCITKQREMRYQHCSELADDLARFEAGIIPAAMGVRAATMHEVAPAKASRKGLIASVLALAVLGMSGAGALVVSQRNDQRAALEQQLASEQAARARQLAEHIASQQRVVTPVPGEKIRLTSEPAGAEVYRGDELIGATPLEIPRPTGSERFTLDIKQAGFDTRQAILSNLTAANINFVLTATSTTARRTSTDMRDAPAPEGRVERNDVAPTPMTPAPNSELYDPWDPRNQ